MVRELIVSMSMSLDGFVSGPSGEVEWIFNGDQEAIAWKFQTASNAGLHIMGSQTFLAMAAHWPTATAMFARPMNDIPKAVFSRQGLAILVGAVESWGDAYVATADLAHEIGTLKAMEGKPIVAHGGAAFVRSLVAEDLVDEYRLMVHPVALGKGLPIFSDLAAQTPFRLMSSKAFPLGTVAQIYRRPSEV